MYPVSQTYWNEVWDPSRSLSVEATIYGTVEGSEPQRLTIEQIISINSTDSLMNESNFEIGNAVMKSFSLSFFDDTGAFLSIGLGGATIDIYTTMNETQVFVGRYYIDEVNTQGKVVSLECVDAMAFTDVPYTTAAAYPMPLYLAAQDVAQCAGLTLTNATISNGNLTVASAPADLTCRQMLQYIAQIAGAYVKASRNQGKSISFVNLEETKKTVPLGGMFAVEVAENPIKITGIAYGDTYLAGTAEYAIKFSENPIMEQFDATTINSVLNSLYSLYGSISYYPCRAKISSNAALETGDIITLTKEDGSTFLTVLSQVSYSGLSQYDVVGSGATREQNKYITRGPITAKVSEILKEVSEITNVKLPGLSQAIVDATSKIIGSVSGYIYIPEENDPYGLSTGQFLVMDSSVPTDAVNVWRWNLSGLGFSNSGVNGTYETAITQDGEIVANFITSGILNATVIQTGLLSSINETSWIDLDDGTFNFGNGTLVFDGTKLNIVVSSIRIQGETESYEVATKDEVAGVQEQVNKINEDFNTQKGFINIDPNVPQISLGSQNAAANVNITNEAVTISGSDNAKAVLQGSQLSAPQASFDNVRIGSFLWVHRTANKHLSLKWVGDS